jgi:Zn-dependent M28 family amino/carboxypeptidase
MGGDGPGKPVKPQHPDAELKAILRDIDPANIEAIVRRLVSFGTRHTLSSQDDPVRGIGAARDWIFATLQGYAAASGGRMTVELQSFVQQPGPRIPVPTVITNVIATLHGDSAPGRVYVVTGHYDSRVTDVMNATSDAPGADDDGSGVAVLMELARVMATRPSEATIVFAAVAGEEQNIYGSTFMAQTMKAANTDIQGMFSNDIVGSSTAEDGTRDRRTVRLFAEGVPTSETPAQASVRQAVGGENDSASRQLGRFAVDVADNGATGMNIRVVWRRDRYLRGSDHISFLAQGYPAARFTEPAENFAHQHQDVRVENGVQFGDLPEFCDFDYIAGVARVNAATLWSLAQGPGTPKNVRIITANLTNSTTLRWNRGTEADLAGYEVVWRETTSPDWTNAIDVGDVTEVTIDLSKDNVFFGVRAIDTAGHHSPVAFPVPASS